MKYFILTIALVFSFSFSSFAQLADGSIAPDFTTTDVNGNTHRLYDYLDAGYTVILDISATWCTPCWNYHAGGTFEEIWEAHGPAGQPGVSENTTDDVMILWFEGDASTDLSELENSALGNWLQPDPNGEPVHFPMSNDDNIANLYDLPYWPIIYTICPSRVISESGQANAAVHYANLDDCPVAVEGVNASLVSYDGNLAPNGCETTASGNVSVTVQNLGSEALTDFSVEVIENGNTIATQDYSGSLAVYELTTIDFGNLTISSDYEIVITSTDENAADNVISQTLNFAGETSQMVTVSFLSDSYASESYLEIKDENGNIVWFEGNESIAGQYATGNENPSTDPTNPLTNNTQYDWEVNLPSTGCFTLTVGDFYGDGLFASQWGGADGTWSIKDNNGTIFNQMSSSEVFIGTDNASFSNDEAGQPASIEAIASLGLNVYPNPVVNNATLELSLSENSTVNMEIVNVLGELVSSEIYNLNAGNNKINFNVNNVESGIYFVKLNINGLTTTKKITVSK
jgi:hypothetical protein